jgi:hypothetical protein
MSAVSQLKFWKDGDTNNNADGESGGAFLSYNVFIALSIVGGFLGLDHLYLRSPGTFIAKLLVNLAFFGIWWIWDAVQAIFNEKMIRIYGLGIPGFPGMRIASGVLADEEADGKHLRFFIYSLALFFGGIIGMDSFLLGDTEIGVFRLLSCITIIFFPIAFIAWGYYMVQFLMNPKDVIGMNPGFFGSNMGENNFGGFITKFISELIGPAAIPFLKGTEFLAQTTGNIKDVVKGVASVVTGSQFTPAAALYSSTKTADFQRAMQKTQDTPQKKSSMEMSIGTSGSMTDSIGDAAKNAMKGVNMGALGAAAGDLMKKMNETPAEKTQPEPLPNVNPASTLASAPVEEKAKDSEQPVNNNGPGQPIPRQSGGGNLNLLPYTLLGTVVLVISSGIYKNFTKKNEPKDDIPPKPSGVRTIAKSAK